MRRVSMLDLSPAVPRGRSARQVAIFLIVLALATSGRTGSRVLKPRSGAQRPASETTSTTTCTGTGGSEVPAALAGTATTPEFQAIVLPGTARTISYAGATLNIGSKAVRLPTGIGISRTAPGKLRRLDGGMTNVTAGPVTAASASSPPAAGGFQGGFNQSSQHLYEEVLGWVVHQDGSRRRRGGRRCRRRVGQGLVT